MLYCPRCRATYEEGTVRFCTNDNTRLVPAPSKGKSAEEEPQGTFTNILGENLFFGETDLLKPRMDRSSGTRRKGRRGKRKPLFAPSFKPPKGSRFFKAEEEETSPEYPEKIGAEPSDLGAEKEEKLVPETSFKDVSLAGVIDSPVEETEVKEEPLELEVSVETEETATDDLIGQTLKNRYEISEKICESDFIRNYLAQDKIALNRKVIVTIFNKEKTESEESEPEKIFGDARGILTKVKHPNIETVLDSGDLPDGNSFIVSELLKGKPLSELIKENEEFSPERTANIVRQVSSGLSELHQKGFIYRHLRPERIILGTSSAGTEQVKILNPVISGGEVRGGDPAYRSPEQIEGNVVTIATDTYALGGIAYHLLTGRKPFEAENEKDLFELQKKPTKTALAGLKEELPSGIYDVLKRSLAFDSVDRYIQVRHFGDAFYKALIPDSAVEENRSEPEAEEQTTLPVAVIPDVADEVIEDQTEAQSPEEISAMDETSEELPETGEFSETEETVKTAEPLDVEESTPVAGQESEEYEHYEEFEESWEQQETFDEPLEEEITAESPLELETSEAEFETSEEELEITEEEPETTGDLELSDDIIGTAPIAVQPLTSSGEDIFDLDIGDEEEVPASTEDQIIELDDQSSEAVSSDQQDAETVSLDEIDEQSAETISLSDEDLFGLDTGETVEAPSAWKDSSDVELDLLDDGEVTGETPSDDFELDVGEDETEDEEASVMPLNAAIASVASDLHLDEDKEIETPVADAGALPEIELDLEGLDETPADAQVEETLPAIEFDLDEIDGGIPIPLEKLEEPVPAKEPAKPRIRIIKPEKPYYEEPKAEEVEEQEQEKAAPVVISAGDVKSGEDKEVGKKIVGDEEEKDYSWVLLPLLLLLLLIAAFAAAFWYFSGQQDRSSLTQNTNTQNGQIAVSNQSVNGQQSDANALDENGNLANSEAIDDSNSETDFFGENFGAPGGGSVEGGSGGSATVPKLPRSQPPPPRNLKKKPNNVRFRNSRKKTPRKLRNDFLGFTVDYPKDWKKNSTSNNFLDISKNARDGSPIKQFLITKYDSTGTFNGDRAKFRDLVEKSNEDLKAILPNYEIISEGETIIQNGRWMVYEVKFKGSGVSGGRNLTVWGRRFWLPIQRPGMESGFVITMLASSLASDVKGIEDVGDNGELAEILESFEPTLND